MYNASRRVIILDAWYLRCSVTVLNSLTVYSAPVFIAVLTQIDYYAIVWCLN